MKIIIKKLFCTWKLIFGQLLNQHNTMINFINITFKLCRIKRDERYNLLSNKLNKSNSLIWRNHLASSLSMGSWCLSLRQVLASQQASVDNHVWGTQQTLHPFLLAKQKFTFYAYSKTFMKKIFQDTVKYVWKYKGKYAKGTVKNVKKYFIKWKLSGQPHNTKFVK